MTNMLRWWHPYIVSFVLEDFLLASCTNVSPFKTHESWLAKSQELAVWNYESERKAYQVPTSRSPPCDSIGAHYSSIAKHPDTLLSRQITKHKQWIKMKIFKFTIWLSFFFFFSCIIFGHRCDNLWSKIHLRDSLFLSP